VEHLFDSWWAYRLSQFNSSVYLKKPGRTTFGNLVFGDIQQKILLQIVVVNLKLLQLTASVPFQNLESMLSNYIFEWLQLQFLLQLSF
jgi:hypothetical protein